MVSSIGMSSGNWEQINSEYKNRYAKYMRNPNSVNATNTTAASSTEKNSVDSFSSSDSGNKCTDGKDDGKIGFFSAIGHTLLGAGKALVNGIKGMFTDENGNFSLLKTLGTVAMGALCIAFPAVGLVACGIGAVTGAVKVGSGVYNALNAKTDAQAKDYWEQVGDGGLTVGLSVAGAKASYGAVAKSAGADGAINTMKASGEWANATKLQKAGALGKDMVASTKNNLSQIKNSAQTTKEAMEIHQLRQKVSKMEGALTDEELAMKNKLDAMEVFSDEKVLAKADKIQAKTNGIAEAKSNVKTAKDGLNEAQKTLKELKKNNASEETIAAAKEAVKNKKAALNEAKSEALGFGKLTKKVKTTTAEGWQGVKEAVKNKKVDLTNARKVLSDKGNKIVDFLTKEDGKFYEAVNKFGYENVAEALEVLAVYQLTNESV